MCSPVSAILWEIGRKNRWGLLVVVGSLLCGLMVRVFGAGPEAEPNFFGVVGMIVSFLVTFAIWTYADSGAQISFPTRTFALPVRTGVLVNGPIFFGALGITAIHFAWAFLLLLPLGTHYPLGLFTIYWIADLMTFQAIVWCLASWPKALVIVLVLAVVLFVLLAAALVASSEAIRVDVCLLIILPVAYLTARLGIDRQRCGRWHLPAKVRALADKLARVRFRRGRPFATAAQAQLWMESRANAATPLIALGAGLIAVCAVFVHLADRDGV